MRDHDLSAARATTRPPSGKLAARKSGRPAARPSGRPAPPPISGQGTGKVTYTFTIEATDDLKKKNVENPLRFHRDVVRLIFGPMVDGTAFMRRHRYSKVKWSDERIAPGATHFPYYLTNRLIDKIGRLPVMKPTRIVDSTGQEIDDIVGHGGHAAVTARLHNSSDEMQQLLLGGIGFDPGNLRSWNTLSSVERLTTLQDVDAIMGLLGELDDADYVELLRTIRPVGNHFTTRVVRISPYRVHEFMLRLQAMKALAEVRGRKTRIAGIDVSLGAVSLDGCAKLFFLIEKLKQTPPELTGGMVRIGGGGSEYKEIESAAQRAVKAEINAELIARGLTRANFDARVRTFLKDFERRAALFARDALNRHLRLFEYHVSRTDSKAMVAAIKAHGGATLTSIFNVASRQSPETIKSALAKSEARYGDLIKDFPLMRYGNFWAMFAESQKHLKGNFSVAHFNVLVAETRSSIVKMLSELEDPGYVWEGDVLVNGALASFGMYDDPSKGRGHNAMLTLIVHRKMAKEQRSGAFTSLLLAVAALALSLTGIGWMVAMGVALSLLDVYMMIDDRTKLRTLELSGLSARSPPSDFWILLAVAGAAVDVGGLMKVLNGPRIGAAMDSAAALETLLVQANIKSQKARRLAHKLRVIKVQVEQAKRELRLVASSLMSVGAGLDAGINVAYHMARLGLTEFRHFVMELKTTVPKGMFVDSDEFDVVMAALEPHERKRLTRMFEHGLHKARNDVATLDALIEAAETTAAALAAARTRARALAEKRFAKGVSRKLSDTKSPYNTLRKEHHTAMEQREQLVRQFRAERAHIKFLQTLGRKVDAGWGEFAEDWVRLTPIKGQPKWPQMNSKNRKSVDSIRKRDQKLEIMQSKAIVHPSDAVLNSPANQELIKKAKEKIRLAATNFRSQKFKDFSRNFNENRFPFASNHHGLDMPTNWKDPSLTIHLEIPIVTHAAVDTGALRAAVRTVFEAEFPQNAVLRIRTVTPKVVSDTLTKAGLRSPP